MKKEKLQWKQKRKEITMDPTAGGKKGSQDSTPRNYSTCQ